MPSPAIRAATFFAPDAINEELVLAGLRIVPLDSLRSILRDPNTDAHFDLQWKEFMVTGTLMETAWDTIHLWYGNKYRDYAKRVIETEILEREIDA